MLVLAAVRLPHFAADDAACAPVVVTAYGEHDESQHALQSATTEAADEHCAICHWTRSLRSPRPSLAGQSAAAAAHGVAHWTGEAEVLTPSLERLPARAPPSRQ